MLAVLCTIGLTLIGLKHVLVMGSIAALLTIVPYVGTILVGMFPAATTLLSSSGNVNPLAAILFIPLLGMLQIVCQHVPSLQPYAYLIGTQEKPEKQYVQRVKQWVQNRGKKQ